jgi:hypothetical protein
MDRHTATEDQAESHSYRSQSPSPHESSGLPMQDNVEQRGLSHVSDSAIDAAHWPSLLEELDVRFLVLDMDRDAELFELFQAHSRWVIDSQDERVVLLARTDVGPNPAGS